MKEQTLELLAPAGSYDIFKAVMNAGADAVYVGGNKFGARAYANNFSEEELLCAINQAHLHGKKLYLTVNTLLKEKELEEQLYHYLLPYYNEGLDAVIAQDMGAFQLIHDFFPHLEIHTSTQMTVCSRYGAQMMKELGASRIVTAREMSFEEIKEIADHVDIEIESFVHGALCYCFSGQCLLSSMLGGRSGNRGRCAQPCRLPYEVYHNLQQKEKIKPYILSLKDLCTIEQIPQLAKCGIYSLKIEGRMKQAEYAAGVVSVYRQYIDAYFEHGEKAFQVSKKDMQKLYDFGNRCGFTKGYYEKQNGKDMITFEKPSHTKTKDALGEPERFLEKELKENINGKLILSQDFPAILEVSYQNNCYTASGDVVSCALKQPLSLEKVKENIKKTGNTPFSFQTLEIEMDDAVFLPIKSLNQLRRDALEGLEQKLLKQYKRNDAKPFLPIETEKSKESRITHLSVSIEQRMQLKPLLDSSFIETIYLDQSCYNRKTFFFDLQEDIEKIHASGKKAFYIFPAVLRKKTEQFYKENSQALKQCRLDGFAAKSYDTMQFLKQYFPEIPMLLDASIYLFNQRAKKVMENFKPIRTTAPYELNRKELAQLNQSDSEMVLYGYLPLMTSAQCVHANAKTCDKNSGILYLKDRYGKFFPVKNHCTECYNTIYNSTPLMLFCFEKELHQMGFSYFRLSFTIEDKKEIQKVLEAYKTAFLEKKKLIYENGYTNGHYKRGVE